MIIDYMLFGLGGAVVVGLGWSLAVFIDVERRFRRLDEAYKREDEARHARATQKGQAEACPTGEINTGEPF